MTFKHILFLLALITLTACGQTNWDPCPYDPNNTCVSTQDDTGADTGTDDTNNHRPGNIGDRPWWHDTDDAQDTGDTQDTDTPLLDEPFPGSIWYHRIDQGLAETQATSLESPVITEPDLDRVHIYEPGTDVEWIPVYAPGDCSNPGSLQADLPLPVDQIQAIPADEQDNMLTVVVNPNNPEQIAELNWLSICDDGAFAVAWVNHGDGIWQDLASDYNFKGAQGGSHLSALGGTIRMGEIASGEISHVVKVELDNGQLYFNSEEEDFQSGYRWPAHSADSYASHEYAGTDEQVQMGTLLTVPQSYDCETLLTAEATTICVAMQVYGALVVDDTYYEGAVALVVESGVDDELEESLGYDPEANTGGWYDDMQTLFAALQVVTNPEEAWSTP